MKSLYVGLIYENQYGEFLVRRIGYKGMGRPIVMFSSLGLPIEEGVYLMERMNFPLKNDCYFDLGLPVYPVRKLLSVSECRLDILGNTYMEDYSKLKEVNGDSSISELEYFLNCIAYPVDEMLSLDFQFTSVSRIAYQLKLNSQKFQINFLENLRSGMYNFADILRYAVSPIHPSPETANLIPAISDLRNRSRITTFYDLSVPIFESNRNHLVTIRTEEDYAKWSNCFNPPIHADFVDGSCMVTFNKNLSSKMIDQLTHIFVYHGDGFSREIRVQFIEN